MKHNTFRRKGQNPIEKTAKKMLESLFGPNIILTTQFEFLCIEDKISLEPEYYYTERFKFFDFWYNPKQEWLPQLALALADYYHALSGQKGDIRKTANRLLASAAHQ